MDCCIATSSRPKFTRPSASLEGPKSKPHYRRSTTTKAPRKRTFIMNMEKYNPGVRSEGAGGMLCKVNAAASSELLQTCCGGNDGFNMGGNGGKFVRRLSGNPGGDSNSFGSAQPLPRAVVLGAAALLAGLVFLPSQAVASSAFRNTGRVAALPQPSNGPRNMCLNNTCLVEPGTPLPDNAIVYGQVQLTEAERRLIGGRQLFFRETLRCEALSL